MDMRNLSHRIINFIGSATFLIIITSILLIFGLAMSYSASFVSNGESEIIKQLIFTVIGIAGLVAIVVIGRLGYANERFWFIFTWILLAVFFLLMVAVRIPGLGVAENGAYRWLVIGGFNFQPSEFFKIAVLLTSVVLVLQWRKNSGMAAFALFAVMVLTIVTTYVLQNDMGSTMIIFVGILTVLVLGNLPIGKGGKFIIPIILGVAVLFLIGSYFVHSFRMERWDSFMASIPNITSGDGSVSYQAQNGYFALAGNGQGSGLDLGLSMQKYGYLSASDNDYIFAIIGEEMGIFGTLLVVGLFLLFSLSGLLIALRAGTIRGRMIAGGATVFITFQALINLASVTGAGPLTGKPLPFFSTGGSSMISTLMLVGLIVMVALFDHAADPVTARRDRFRLVNGSADSNSGAPGEQPGYYSPRQQGRQQGYTYSVGAAQRPSISQSQSQSSYSSGSRNNRSSQLGRQQSYQSYRGAQSNTMRKRVI
ncbi:MAG: FtsW/RodA/SpoVE family cell cycle protein [Coriobacteriales bacterium]|jgi:cell division protein FtsW|nr:FtsW/RodA/SpoVE family cell cycle protein [Coriobacteriales bacterium]